MVLVLAGVRSNTRIRGHSYYWQSWLVLVLALVLAVLDGISAGWCQKYCENSWP